MTQLVSVVTATWQRPQTIVERAITSIRAQTYDRIQHIIVTDGSDIDLTRILRAEGYREDVEDRRLVTLGRNWTAFSGDDHFGSVPKLVGSYAASGDYIAYLDDDDEYLPDHVETLAAALDLGHDLAIARWLGPNGKTYGGFGDDGELLCITASLMHVAELLNVQNWQRDGYGGENRLVKKWIDAGCKWTVVERPTIRMHSHRHGTPDHDNWEK